MLCAGPIYLLLLTTAGLCTPHPVFLSVKFTTHNQIYIDFLPDCLLTTVKRSIIMVSASMINFKPETETLADSQDSTINDLLDKIYN